jgi:hypothetical protein
MWENICCFKSESFKMALVKKWIALAYPGRSCVTIEMKGQISLVSCIRVFVQMEIITTNGASKVN